MTFLRSFILFLAFASSFSNRMTASSRKELRGKEKVQLGTVLQLGHSIRSNIIDPSRVVQLSWQPRVFLYNGFLTDEECDHLISLADREKKNLLEINGNSGRSIANNLLGKSETKLKAEDVMVPRIEERLSAWTFLPKENSRPLQVTHFGLGEAEKNADYFGNQSKFGVSEPLMATVILYLSNVTRGGEILFRDLEGKSKIPSDCTKTTNVLRLVKGNAVLFFNVHPNASPDKSSSHFRCPFLEGEMWYAIKFFHLRSVIKEKVPFGSDGSESDDSECADEDESCPQWAALGECQRNPVFMIGSPDYYGACRKSCNAC
ncbi:ShK domain-containing protein [Cephalotus follicularis]|uniref:procollagen-proline 4-dioxygenase n=1 Tax=Cephalotus follicularis TaxID=3775 RepID=A0A1Q3CGB9_CEPFO|nr:ShK domain-containing protein [Cephalotus follicularis]